MSRKVTADYQGVVLKALIDGGIQDVDKICDWIIQNKLLVKKDDFKMNNRTRTGEENVRQRIRNHLRSERPLILKGFVKVQNGKYSITRKGKTHFEGLYSNDEKIIIAKSTKDNEKGLDDSKYSTLLKGWFDEGIRQFILEGPAGTGKTRLARAIIDDGILTDGDQPTDFLSQIDRFATFVQFHPSYCYEDFVEGLRPATSISGELIFNVKRGPFALSCARAINNAFVGKLESDKLVFETHTIQHLSSIDPEISEIVLKTEKSELHRFSVKSIIIDGAKTIVTPTSKIDSGLLADSKIFARINDPLCLVDRSKDDYILTSDTDYELISSGSEAIKEIWLLNEDLQVMGSGKLDCSSGKVVKKTFFENIGILGEWTYVQSKEVHYFVIDEINRANAAEVFGELLVQLEYRLGFGRPIPIRLPYSADLMLIPENLVLFGTMNNSDRSLLKLDRALLRRFHIISVAPDPKVLSELTIEKIPVDRVLIKLNSIMAKEFGNDVSNQVGHAYFVRLKEQSNIAELKRIWYFGIFPLVFDFSGGDVELLIGLKLFPELDLSGSNIQAYIKVTDYNFKAFLYSLVKEEQQGKAA